MAETICKFIIITLFFYSATATVSNTRYYPRYHFVPPFGWMNDPNGFSNFQDNYQLFYQYNPESSQEAGIANWGHAVSSDLVHWQHLPIAMKPDESYDKTGVFSGSAIAENDTLYLIYTGNVNFANQTPDHQQVQALAFTTDGVNVTKYSSNPIIEGTDLQPDIRDPKVWKHGDYYYMVLGNSINDTYGRIFLFNSTDLINWEKKSVLLQSNGTLGYMFECPDFMELNGTFMLLFSPQGIQPQGDKYNNLYQTGFILGKFDYDTGIFEPTTEFTEIDKGTDFYATQTILDKNGRRIMIAWCSMWEQVYPERNDGFAGMMTVPRELLINSKGQLIQKPIEELDQILGTKLYSGEAGEGQNVTLSNKSGKVTVRASKTEDFTLYIQDSSNSSNQVIAAYSYNEGKVTVDRGGENGLRRTDWTPQGEELYWTIYIDASSVELFCGEGEITFSDRFFPESDSIVVALGTSANYLSVHEINRSVPLPES